MIEFSYKYIYKFLSMFQDQCISVTDLRTQTKKCLEDLEKAEKYVFINNKPKAVIVDIKYYELLKEKLEQLYSLVEIPETKVTHELKTKIAETKKLNKSVLINI